MTKFSHVLVLFGLPLLLCQCTEREDAAQKPPTLQELYSAAANGDNAAFTALLLIHIFFQEENTAEYTA